MYADRMAASMRPRHKAAENNVSVRLTQGEYKVRFNEAAA